MDTARVCKGRIAAKVVPSGCSWVIVDGSALELTLAKRRKGVGWKKMFEDGPSLDESNADVRDYSALSQRLRGEENAADGGGGNGTGIFLLTEYFVLEYSY
jgi:hypothetical protein